MLEELKEQYRLTLPDKISTIKSLLQELREGTEGAETRLRHLAHTLHGSGSTFGYPEISQAARAVEHSSNEELLKQLVQLIRVLVTAAATNKAVQRPAILLIDDDPDITNLMVALLNQKCPEHQVVVAATGAEASQLFDARPFALIVLDLVLTDSDGRQILRQLSDSLQRDTPVFVLSGVDQSAVRDECLALGARAFFTKPFKPNQIADAIATAVKAPATGVVAAIAPAAPATTAREQAPDLPVLVAEDDELLAGVIKHRLGREGFQVIHVTDGASALTALAERQYSLVILDVKMPVKDGFEVLTLLRATHSKEELPVVMLTAMGSEKDIVRGYGLGANDYMLKPFSPTELLAKVKSLLRAGRRG